MITILTDKYLQGLTTKSEEQELLHLLGQIEQRTAEQETLLLMLSTPAVTCQQIDTWMQQDEQEEYDRLVAEHHHRKRHIQLRVWSIAASVLLVLSIGITALMHQPQTDAVAWVYGQKVQDEEAVMQLMASTMEEVMNTPSDESIAELSNILNHE